MTDTRAGVAATVLFAVCAAEVVTGVVCGVASGLGWGALNNLLVMSNAAIGLALGASGWPIAALRPRNPIGWLLLGGGISYASTAPARGWPVTPVRRNLRTSRSPVQVFHRDADSGIR